MKTKAWMCDPCGLQFSFGNKLQRHIDESHGGVRNIMKLHDHQSDEQCSDGSCGPNPFRVAHTPTPWTFEAELNGLTYSLWSEKDDFFIAETQMKTDVAFIVRAVNAYEKDQEIKKELIEALNDLMPTLTVVEEKHPEIFTRGIATLNYYRRLIAKAEGK